MAALQLVNQNPKIATVKLWWERAIALLLVTNFALVLFNLSYLPWRDHYQQHLLQLVQRYDKTTDCCGCGRVPSWNLALSDAVGDRHAAPPSENTHLVFLERWYRNRVFTLESRQSRSAHWQAAFQASLAVRLGEWGA
ncbi:MAG: hypothetical protein HC838_16630 [Spirulinaceae cyanobacterium RM2_2_10]|nr:hypothetical protein [Spirulinaceae cyanobacterium SM2_1_0]NJO21332.1 hypothetical protein [Spirulinaceae cyanobacterium RM2_2_10]